MTIDFKRLLKECQKRISGGLNLAPANPRTTLAGGPGSPAQDDQSKELNGAPLDRARAGSEDASLQHPQWDRFFASLLNPQAMPELDRSTGATAGSGARDVQGGSLADV